MSYKCTVCGKGPSAGNNVSHSKRHTRRTFRPNLKKVRFIVAGSRVHSYVCTSCLKAGKVAKAL